MTADREGLTVTTRTLKWLELLVLVVALGGPPASFLASLYVQSIRQEAIDAAQNRRLDLAEAVAEKHDDRWDRLSDRLTGMDEKLNRLLGKLDK